MRVLDVHDPLPYTQGLTWSHVLCGHGYVVAALIGGDPAATGSLVPNRHVAVAAFKMAGCLAHSGGEGVGTDL